MPPTVNIIKIDRPQFDVTIKNNNLRIYDAIARGRPYRPIINYNEWSGKYQSASNRKLFSTGLLKYRRNLHSEEIFERSGVNFLPYFACINRI